MMTRTILAATATLLAAHASPSFGQATVKDGVFTNSSGMTLYTFHKDFGSRTRNLATRQGTG